MKSQRVYLNDLLTRIGMIESFTSGGRDEFMESLLIQESVIRSYEVIGEIVKRLAPELTASQADIPWKRIAGFRDFLIYNYDKVDLVVVWKIVEEDLQPLKLAVLDLLQKIDDTDEP